MKATKKIGTKLKAKRTYQQWDDKRVRVDVIQAPRRTNRHTTVAARVSHEGRRPSAVIDVSLATKEIERVRELGRWLNSVADFLGDSRD